METDPCQHQNEVVEQEEEEEDIPLLAPHGMDISDHPLAEILPTNSVSQCQTPSLAHVSPFTHQTVSRLRIQSPLATAPIITPASNFHHPDERSPVLPRVFAPFSSQMNATDLSYLHCRDALTLPSEKLQIALLKAYEEFVHSTMPILDLEEFLSIVKYGEQAVRKHLKLLLFQAVMFAGVEYVSLKALRDECYGGRETAKRILFSRVKLLYDFDTTTDRYIMIQSLLLMSLYTTPLRPRKDHKDAHHYLGLAISLSFSLGMNRELPYPPSQINLRRKRVARRMWWSIVVRDRVLAIEGCSKGRMGRGTRIRREDCDVDMLKLDDFEPGYCDDEEGGTEEMKARLNAETFIEKVKLCWWSGDGLGLTQQFSIPTAAPPKLFQQQHTYTPNPVFQQTTQQQPQICSEASPSYHHQHTPIFETQEEADYNLNTNSISSPSTHSDCLTPQDETSDPTDSRRELEGKAVFDSPLGAGFGVDGEYDDYLEYLKGAIDDDVDLKRSAGGAKAWQLDCEGGRILEN